MGEEGYWQENKNIWCLYQGLLHMQTVEIGVCLGWVWEGSKVGHELTLCTHSPEDQMYSGQQVEQVDYTSLICFGKTSPGELCPALESSAEKRQRLVGARLEERHKNDQGVGTPLQRRKVKVLWLFSLEERRVWQDISVVKKAYDKSWGESL